MNDVTELRFLPLDLPYVECDSKKIKQYMDTNSVRVDYNATNEINNPWNHVIIRSPLFKRQRNTISGSGWRDDFKNEFSHVVQSVENLPYSKISFVYLFEQCIDVKPHLDSVGGDANKSLEPASYRMNLLFEDENTFYICDNDKCTNFSYPSFPKDSNTWVFSNKKYKHGSILPKGKKRKILLIIGNSILDHQKHFELLERSYKKYSQFTF